MQGWQDLEAGLTGSAPGHSAEETEHASCTATLEDLRIVVNLLQGLSTGKKDQLVTVSTPPQALRVSAETQARNLYGVAYINENLMSAYNPPVMDGEVSEVKFKVNLRLLLECLQVFGSSALATAHCQLAYNTSDCILQLLLEESGIVTEVQLSTSNAADEVDYLAVFRDTPVIVRCSISSNILAEAVAEVLTLPGVASISIAVQPTAPQLRITAVSDTNTAAVDFVAGGTVFLAFECSESHVFSYPALSIIACTRVLGAATESYLRINAAGHLSILHKCLSSSGVECFLSFNAVPEATLEDSPSDSGTAATPAAAAAAATRSPHPSSSPTDTTPAAQPTASPTADLF